MKIRLELYAAVAVRRYDIGRRGSQKAIQMPWEETKDYIRSGHESTEKYDKDSLRTISFSEAKGIKAIVGCPKGEYDKTKCEVGTHVVSYLFAKEKGWTLVKAKDWFEKNKK
jgi:hypothetical protein